MHISFSSNHLFVKYSGSYVGEIMLYRVYVYHRGFLNTLPTRL